MKRTRWTRIALALQFDDYSDNLLESSLARTIYDYDYDYVYVYDYVYDYVYAMAMPMPSYGNYMAVMPMLWLCL